MIAIFRVAIVVICSCVADEGVVASSWRLDVGHLVLIKLKFIVIWTVM